jgi:hypothetical protein
MLSSEAWAEPDCHTRILKEVAQQYLPKPFPAVRPKSPPERKQPDRRSFARLERLDEIVSASPFFNRPCNCARAKRVESKPWLESS